MAEKDNKITGEKKDFWCECAFCDKKMVIYKDVYCPPSIHDWTAEVHNMRYRLDVMYKIVTDELAKLDKKKEDKEVVVSTDVEKDKK